MLKALPAVVSALPDLMLGATFLITWVSPYALREKMVAYLMLLMILEFIIVHSSAFMGRVMVGPLLRGRKSVTLLGLGGCTRSLSEASRSPSRRGGRWSRFGA